jgi:predicted transcriptional regulator
MGLTQREAAKLLGVTEARVSQLKTTGKLTEFSEASIEAYTKEKTQSELKKREYHQRQEDARRERHEAILNELRTLNLRLLLLAAALGAKGIADTIPR